MLKQLKEIKMQISVLAAFSLFFSFFSQVVEHMLGKLPNGYSRLIFLLLLLHFFREWEKIISTWKQTWFWFVVAIKQSYLLETGNRNRFYTILPNMNFFVCCNLTHNYRVQLQHHRKKRKKKIAKYCWNEQKWMKKQMDG